MLNGVDDIWEHLKAKAKSYADADGALPDDAECAQEVERIVQEVLGSSAAISPEATEFYSAELCAMAEDLRKNRRPVR